MIKINKLDNDTINKIAAGEVIERPMSVVKELVENAIDASSDEIVIEIKNGGKDYIRISDNGHGMNYDQINDAFKRHYTSKISKADDLITISTLGFRGEALASISQVSRVEVYTKTSDEITGVRMIYEGGKVISKEEFGCQNGTTFIIRDLFYNVPARLKFLKSASAEASAINTAVTSLALVKKNISFKYINNGKTVFKTPKTEDMINVLSCLYDKDLVSSMIAVSCEYQGMKVEGYTSNLNYYRGNKKNQLLFINDRLVKHVRAHYFIESAYNTYLPINKHPACFLNLTINPKLIDVNVHPAKTEVRIYDEDRVLGILKAGVSQALKNKNLVKEVKAENIIRKFNSSKNSLSDIIDNGIEIIEVDNIDNSDSADKTASNSIYNGKRTDYDVCNLSKIKSNHIDGKNSSLKNLNTNIFDIGSDSNISIPTKINDTAKYNNYKENIDIDDLFEDKSASSISKSPMENDYSNKSSYINNRDSTNILEKDDETISKFSVGEEIQPYISEQTNIKSKLDNPEQSIHEEIANLKTIGVLFKTYILCEDIYAKVFYMVDQHAAHERINYENYMEQYLNKKVIQQEMLIPEVIDLGFDDNNIYEENKDLFSNLGFNVEIFGNNSYKINSIPLILCDKNVKLMFMEILDSIKSSKAKTFKDEIVRKIIKKSCVDAVKAHDNLKDIEIKALLKSLSKCEKPYTCPHGRPIIIKLSKYEIERMFERIQI